MSRSMTVAMAEALAAEVARPVLFFEGAFATGTVRLWTGTDATVWAGQTWAGLGTLVGVSNVEEGEAIEARSVTVTLSGVPSGLVSAALGEARQGLPGKVWLGLLDEDGALIPDPVPMFAGRLDVPSISDGQDTCVISISYESRLIDLNRPREVRYTHEMQQQLHPGDRGLEYVTSIQDRKITWGSA